MALPDIASRISVRAVNIDWRAEADRCKIRIHALTVYNRFPKRIGRILYLNKSNAYWYKETQGP